MIERKIEQFSFVKIINRIHVEMNFMLTTLLIVTFAFTAVSKQVKRIHILIDAWHVFVCVLFVFVTAQPILFNQVSISNLFLIFSRNNPLVHEKFIEFQNINIRKWNMFDIFYLKQLVEYDICFIVETIYVDKYNLRWLHIIFQFSNQIWIFQTTNDNFPKVDLQVANAVTAAESKIFNDFQYFWSKCVCIFHSVDKSMNESNMNDLWHTWRVQMTAIVNMEWNICTKLTDTKRRHK